MLNGNCAPMSEIICFKTSKSINDLWSATHLAVNCLLNLASYNVSCARKCHMHGRQRRRAGEEPKYLPYEMHFPVWPNIYKTVPCYTVKIPHEGCKTIIPETCEEPSSEEATRTQLFTALRGFIGLFIRMALAMSRLTGWLVLHVCLNSSMPRSVDISSEE